jgi:hypothetical protein
MELLECQLDAVSRLSSGKVLYGQVGKGKTATVLRYYVDNEEYRDIYVITTARKRDSGDWEDEAARFGIGTELSCYGRLTVDSWNNIEKYAGVEDGFFVFDEQRVVGNGAWVQAFLKIAKKGNHWVLLSATPGDDWLDYLPVFLANGYYKTKKEFYHRHVKYKHTPWLAYPVIDCFLDEEHLCELRNEVLVEMCMTFEEDSKRVLNWWDVGYDAEKFKVVQKKRWNPYLDQPIVDVAEMYRLMRRVVNEDPSRLEALRELHRIHPRLIVFYNFDYELELLRTLYQETNVFEWNGHRKNKLEDFEDMERWLYLVQYTAGAEAWNCVSTNAMVLWSLNYSYKIFEQVQGRIDRMNTKYTSLFYYILWSNSWIDCQIRNALILKENFNEKKALREMLKSDINEVTQPEETDTWEAEMEAKHGLVSGQFLEVCQI